MAPDLDGSGVPDVDADEHETVPVGPVSAVARLRVLTFAALGSLLSGYAVVAALLALVTATASNASLTTAGVLTAAVPGWLAAHQAPVSIFGLELGVLPLLPTIGVVALTARAAAGAAARLDLRTPRQAWPVVSTIAATHAFAGLVVATITVDAEVTAEPLAACWYAGVVSAVAAAFGVARRCGLFAAVADRADAVAVAGMRTGAFAVVALLAAGGLVLTFGLLTSIGVARDQFPAGVGDVFGMLLLSIGYLPNGLVAAVSFVAGPGFSFGQVAVAPMAFDGSPVLGLPLLAALPEDQAAWWPLLFVLPLAVGIAVGRRLRDVAEDPVVRLRAVAVASGVVAVCFAVLAGLAGGHLGSGPFDPVSMRPVAVSIALVLWTALPASLVAWFGGPRPAVEPMPSLIDEEPEPEDIEPEDAEPDDTEPEDEDEEVVAEVPEPRAAESETSEAARD